MSFLRRHLLPRKNSAHVLLDGSLTETEYLKENLIIDQDEIEIKKKGLPRFKLVKTDVIPAILTALVTTAGFIAALVSFYLMKENELVVLKRVLAEEKAPTITQLENALTNVLASMEAFYALYQFSPIPIDYYKQMVPFVYATPNGQFPNFVNSVTYAQYVQNADRSAFVAKYRAQGGDFANFNLTARDANNNLIPAPVSDFYVVVVQIAPVAGATAILGADLTGTPSRKLSILKAHATGKPTASTKLMLRRDGTGYPGSNLYRVLTGSTGQMIGLVNYAIRIDQLIFSAIPGLAANGIYASVFDLDAPNIDSGYIVNTQLLNGTIMTAQQNNDTLENAAYTTEDTFYFVDRNYKIVLYPSQQFENKHAPYNLKWFALGGSWLSTAFLLGLVSILQLSLRVAHAKKLQREATLQKLVQVKENQKSLRSLLNKIATQEWTTRATINAIDDIVIVIGNTGKVLQSNTYFDRIFKFTEQEFERGVYVKNLFTKLPEQFYNVSDGTPIDTTIKLRFGNEEPIEITVKSLSSEAIMAQDIDSELDDEGEDTKSFVIVGHLKRKLNANKRKSLAIPMLEFDRNFKSEKFRIELLEFSKDSKNEENVLFLMRVLTYKKLNFHQRVELSKSICEMFLLEGAPRQLNLSGETREEELKKINKKVGDIDAFSVIEEIVKKVLLEDVYVNFMEKRKENLSPNGTNQTLTSTGSDEISSLETHDGVQI